MKKAAILLVLFALFPWRSYSQSPDNAKITGYKKGLHSLKGNVLVDHLIEICQEYYDQGFFGPKDPRVDSIALYADIAYKHAINAKYNKGRAEASLMLGFVEKCRFKHHVAIKYIEEALTWSNRNHDLLGKAFGFLGSIYSEGLKDKAKGISYLKQSIDHFTLAGNEKDAGLSMTRLCMLYSSSGMYEEGIDYCTRAMTMAKKIPLDSKNDAWRDFQYIQSSSSIIQFYKLVGNLNDAMIFQRELGQYFRKRKMDLDTDLDVGVLHGMIGNYDSSIVYLKRFTNKNPAVLWGKFELAKTYLMARDYDRAENIFLQCIDSFSKRNKGATTELYSVYAGKLYLEKKDPVKALRYARETFTSKQVFNDRLFLLDKYDFLSNAYYQNTIPDSAFLYFKKYTSLRDSGLSRQYVYKLNNYQREAEDQKRMAEILVLGKDNQLKQQQLKEQHFLQQQKENEISLLHKDNQIKEQELKSEALLRKEKEGQVQLLNKENMIQVQQLQKKDFFRNVLVAGIIAFLLTGFFIFRAMVLKRKNEKLQGERLKADLKMQELVNLAKQAEWHQQTTELEMKALHAQMNPHFIFNCLSSINLFILENQTESASDYLTRFSRLIRMVLMNSQKPLISLEDELTMLRLYLDMERLRFGNAFEFKIHVSDDVSPGQVQVPPLLLQPFCENSIWHGLMQKKGEKSLAVIISQNENMLECCIIDNGIGRQQAAQVKQNGNKYQSMGLQISADRLALLNKNLDVHTFYEIEDLKDNDTHPAGTKVKIGFEYKQPIKQFV